MTSTKCLFGCTDVRYGARIVAVLDFWIGVTLMIKLLSLLNPFYVEYPYNYYFSRVDQMLYDFDIFGHLFLTFVFLYMNYYLKDSTYDRKLHKIHQWLTINTIFLFFSTLSVVYVAAKDSYPEILLYSIPIILVHVYQIYVVKCFYDDELNSFPAAPLNAAGTPGRWPQWQFTAGPANPAAAPNRPNGAPTASADGRPANDRPAPAYSS